MSTPPDQHGDQRHDREGLGGRVRRFIQPDARPDQQAPDQQAPGRPTAGPADGGQYPAPEPTVRPGGSPDPTAGGARSPDPTAGQPRSPDPTAGGPVRSPDPTAGHSTPADVGRPGTEGAGLLSDAGRLRDEWQRVQGTFVDDPRRAVQEAGSLIDRTLDEIRTNVGHGQPVDGTSTEDLRVSFQRYRDFFQRLLSA